MMIISNGFFRAHQPICQKYKAALRQPDMSKSTELTSSGVRMSFEPIRILFNSAFFSEVGSETVSETVTSISTLSSHWHITTNAAQDRFSEPKSWIILSLLLRGLLRSPQPE